ncbi:MAG: hypothetical protein IKF83_05190 [Clostridia bacterium]|nr:hypothetical protein [Clostridia bacterium]
MSVKNKYLKQLLFIISICFAIPSVVFFLKNKTILNFTSDLEYKFLLTDNIDRLFQAIIYAIIIGIFIACYWLIIKNRKKLFKDEKQIYKFVLIISAIFVFTVPFWCSDVFYYLGIGRLTEKYGQNPYYADMKSYIDNNDINIENDTVMQKGYDNYWANTTVVYGAFWTFICSVISFLSLGNIDFGLLIFKIINLGLHLANCYLLYKITNKKIFPLIYGINPFVLIEGITNVHNDMFVIFFMLFSIYEVYKKKRMATGMLFLALATDIKYFSILLLPFLIIYHFRDKDVKTRILKCIQYGTIFAVFAIIPYLLYIRDLNVFMGLSEQRERLAKGLYLFISEYFNRPENFVTLVKNTSLVMFSVIYIYACFMLLFNKKISMQKNMRELLWFVIAFLFLLITNFQPWYFMWLVPFMIWQKSENIKLVVQIQLMTLIANIVFLIYSENYKYGVPFFTIFVIGILVCAIQNRNSKIRRLKLSK